MSRQLTMPIAMRQQLIELAESSAPFEMIGLLGAKPDARDSLVSLAPCKNHSPTPRVAFYVEPYAEQRLHDALALREQVCVGCYHSHLTSDARPSRSDLKMVRPGWLMVIVNASRDQVRAFEDDGTEIEIVPPVADILSDDDDGDFVGESLDYDSAL